jgi:hypothetical protein
MIIKNFEIKCKKCGSTDVCVSTIFSKYSYEDEIYDVEFICNICNSTEVTE